MKNRYRLEAVVPVSRSTYEALALGTPASRAGDLAPHAVAAMEPVAARAKRRVFETPWIERVEESYQGDDTVVGVVFAADTEPVPRDGAAG